MTSLELSLALRRGRKVFGTQIVSPSPRWPEMIQKCGLDFVFLDTEHIALDRHQLSWMCQTYAALGLPPIVRITSPSPYEACVALDGGAAGILAPYIESVEQVQALRGAVKLRPLKGQRLAERLKGEPLEPVLESYIRERNQRALIINIESRPAIENLDNILSVPDIDAVLIGPHDLSCSLGIPEQYDRPEFLAACETIFRKARAAGIGAGIHFSGSAGELARFIQLGANLLIHSADITLFQKYLRRELDDVKKLIGMAEPEPAPN